MRRESTKSHFEAAKAKGLLAARLFQAQKKNQSRSIAFILRVALLEQDVAAIEESARIEDIGYPRPLTAVSLRDLAPHVAVVPLALRFARRFFRVGVTYTFVFPFSKYKLDGASVGGLTTAS